MSEQTMELGEPLREPLVELAVRGRELTHERLGPGPSATTMAGLPPSGSFCNHDRCSVSRRRVLKSSEAAAC